MLIEFSLDIDDSTENMIIHYMRLIQVIGKGRIRKLMYRLSAGGDGYHVLVAISIPDSFKETIKNYESFKLGLRYLFLDCFGRLNTDVARLHLGQDIDRLALYKDGKYAGEWKTFYTSK